MLRVGITGGMGSGKSTVARFFELLEVPVYYADHEAKNLMVEDPFLVSEIKQIFGDQAIETGVLNRAYIASIAFESPEKLAALNAVVHPAVIAHGESWFSRQVGPYALKEAALIFESGSDKQLDYVIGVWCPEALRIERVMNRDNASREEILARMRKQMDETEKMERCDFMITNDEVQAIIPQVLKLHQKLLTLIQVDGA